MYLKSSFYTYLFTKTCEMIQKVYDFNGRIATCKPLNIMVISMKTNASKKAKKEMGGDTVYT